jgi:hypothetical protein
LINHFNRYGSDIGAYGKSDYYWLIPLVIVIGFGALLIPLLGTLMTTLITQGTINLTAGRKKRSIENERFDLIKIKFQQLLYIKSIDYIFNRLEMSAKGNSIPDYIIGLLTKVEEALEKFGNEIKSDDLPFKSTNEANGFVDHN